MQIVIEIPEEDYIRLRDEGMFGNVTTFKRAVREGTPLPEAENHGFIAVCDSLNAVTQEVVDKLKDTVFVGDEDCSYCFDIMEIIDADGGDAE